MNTVWLRVLCTAAAAVSMEPEPPPLAAAGAALRRPPFVMVAEPSSESEDGGSVLHLKIARAELQKHTIDLEKKTTMIQNLVPKLQSRDPQERWETWQTLRLLNDTGSDKSNAGTGDWRMFKDRPDRPATSDWDWGHILSPVGYSIGRGTFGEVVRGTVKCKGGLFGVGARLLYVAVKIQICKPERNDPEDNCQGATSAKFTNRVQNEVFVLEALQHSPYIIRILDSGNYPNPNIDAHAIVMEAGKHDLSGYQETWFVNRLQFVAFAHDIIAGVQAIHQRGLVHADLKANNLFVLAQDAQVALRRPKRLKIGDFSLSCCSTDSCHATTYVQPCRNSKYYTQAHDVLRAGRLVLALAQKVMRFKAGDSAKMYAEHVRTMTAPDAWDEDDEPVSPEEIQRDVMNLPAEYAHTRPYIKQILTCMLHEDPDARCTADHALTIMKTMMKDTRYENMVLDDDLEASATSPKTCKPQVDESNQLPEILGEEDVLIDPSTQPEATELLLAIVNKHMTFQSGSVKSFPAHFNQYLPALREILPPTIRAWLTADCEQARWHAERSEWEMISLMDYIAQEEYPISVVARFGKTIAEHARAPGALFFLRYRLRSTPMGLFYKHHRHDVDGEGGFARGVQNIFGAVGNTLASAGLEVADVFKQGVDKVVVQPVVGVAEATNQFVVQPVVGAAGALASSAGSSDERMPKEVVELPPHGVSVAPALAPTSSTRSSKEATFSDV